MTDDELEQRGIEPVETGTAGAGTWFIGRGTPG